MSSSSFTDEQQLPVVSDDPTIATPPAGDESGEPSVLPKKRGRGRPKGIPRKPTDGRSGPKPFTYDEETGEWIPSNYDVAREEYNHHKIKVEAQKIAPTAMKALQSILEDQSASRSERLKAAQIILDRAGDKPATRASADDDDSRAVLIHSRIGSKDSDIPTAPR